MKVGNLVKVVAPGLRPVTNCLGVVTEMLPPVQQLGVDLAYCYVNMAATQETWKFRVEFLEVVS
jgi:hypothetical protein